MDAIDNPDHGRSVYMNGVKVVERPYVQAQRQQDPTVAPAGGPVFPATEDVEISSTPT